MEAREIVLPETKPALEWIDGEIVQKVRPQRAHALAQSVFWEALSRWARRRRPGFAGTEWEFRLAPPGEIRRPLVPDVAYIAYDHVPRAQLEKMDIPRVAPDVVVEVISPRDRKKRIESKVRTYLACGTTLIFLVDTKKRTVTARHAGSVVRFQAGDVITHPALPGFALASSTLFELP